MGFIIRVTTVSYEQPLKREGKHPLPAPRLVRRSTGPAVLAQAFRDPVVHIPEYPGCRAGPCGTCGHHRESEAVAGAAVQDTSAIAWSLRVLWPHLVDYYVARRSHRARELGPRNGPRGRQPAGAL